MAGRRLLVALLPLALAACATTGTASKDKAPPPEQKVLAKPAAAHAPMPKKVSPYAPAIEDLSTRGNYVAGGLYLPGVADTVPDEIPDVDAIPEPEVRDEPRSRGGNRDYSVLGKRYKVMDEADGYVETGLASYYGKKFHGRRTSNQEVYDMYAFTAAHKTLPLPSFARVTNLDNGKSIVVRINDRGPFHAGRVIDLSYAAAVRLGYRERGTARVEVRALTPADDDTTLAVQQPRGRSQLPWTGWSIACRKHWPMQALSPPRQPSRRCRQEPVPLRHAPGRASDAGGGIRCMDEVAAGAGRDRQARHP